MRLKEGCDKDGTTGYSGTGLGQAGAHQPGHAGLCGSGHAPRRDHGGGPAWRYGEAYEVVARLVEGISKQPFGAYLKQRILEPLGMHDTGFGIPEGQYYWDGIEGTWFWVDPSEELIGLIMMRIEPWTWLPVCYTFQVLTYQALVD